MFPLDILVSVEYNTLNQVQSIPSRDLEREKYNEGPIMSTRTGNYVWITPFPSDLLLPTRRDPLKTVSFTVDDSGRFTHPKNNTNYTFDLTGFVPLFVRN